MSDYKTEPVDEMEDVVAVFYGGRGQWGQQYVITNRRLLIGPLNVDIAAEIDTYVANKLVPGAGDVIKKVLSLYGPASAKTLWLRHVIDVRPTSNASWFRPPQLRITTETEEVLELGIIKKGASRTRTMLTMSRDPSNNAERDRAVAVLRQAVAAAKAVPTATTDR
ncbi:MAG: hypothetical protein WKF65_08545 [Gaiellaceae bacterium]